jgi:FkbM family methyltransferase
MNAASAVRAFLKSRRARRLHAAWVRPGDLCFDVGANRGDRAAVLLALGARVVCVEPQAACREALHRRFGDRVIIVAAACGASPHVADLHVGPETQVATLSPEFRAAFGHQEAIRWTATERVAVTTLDALISEHGVPRFCKIDVEGHEREVLRGLGRAVPVLCFEVTAPLVAMARECLARLQDLGYGRFQLSPYETYRLDPAGWSDGAAFAALLERPLAVSHGDVYALHGA